MPRVHLPDGRVVHFPYDMSPEQIEAEVAKLVQDAPPAAQAQDDDPYGLPPGFEGERPTLSDVAGNLPGALGLMAVGGAVGLGAKAAGAGLRAARQLPVGRILKFGAEHLPYGIGRAVRTVNAGRKIAGSLTTKPAPTPTPTAPAVMHGPTPKPRWSAKETAANMRQQYGSERAGRMLYGGVQRKADAGAVTASAAARREAIKRLAPGESHLPGQAQTAIQRQIAGFTDPAEAFQYAAKAPNAPAQSYIGEQLRAALIDQMKKGVGSGR